MQYASYYINVNVVLLNSGYETLHNNIIRLCLTMWRRSTGYVRRSRTSLSLKVPLLIGFFCEKTTHDDKTSDVSSPHLYHTESQACCHTQQI